MGSLEKDTARETSKILSDIQVYNIGRVVAG